LKFIILLLFIYIIIMSTFTLQGNLKVPNDGHIGSVGDEDAITIDSDGNIGIGTTDPANILHIKKDPTVALGAADYASTNGFGQLHIETVTEFNDGSSDQGTSKLKIGIEDGGVNIAPKGYIQSINDGIFGGTLLLNPSSGNVGIGTTNPEGKLDIRGNTYIRHGADGNNFLSCYTENQDTNIGRFIFRWDASDSASDYNVQVIMYRDDVEGVAGFFDNSRSEGSFTFTGQHRSLMNKNYTSDSKGLIVSSNGKFINMDNSLNPKINQTLPYCILSDIDNDKRVYGVISDKEDSNDLRSAGAGFVKTIPKTNTNEERIFINSLGEGAVWISNKNGSLENGDYITSTTVPGYGGKQIMIEGALMNFTVAKITCDCDFSLTKIVKQKLKVTETTTDGETTQTIDYDSSGNVQYVDDLDSEGAQQMVYKYETRFLQADGTQLVDEADYNTRLANGESVYIACFVGCTYHCG
jgi:hypothetical protein